MSDHTSKTTMIPAGCGGQGGTYKDPWAEVAIVEREIRLLAYTSAGGPTRADDMKMLAIWSGRLQKAINDAAA